MELIYFIVLNLKTYTISLMIMPEQINANIIFSCRRNNHRTSFTLDRCQVGLIHFISSVCYVMYWGRGRVLYCLCYHDILIKECLGNDLQASQRSS